MVTNVTSYRVGSLLFHGFSDHEVPCWLGISYSTTWDAIFEDLRIAWRR